MSERSIDGPGAARGPSTGYPAGIAGGSGNLLTTGSAARLLNVTDMGVKYLIRAGRLRCERVGRIRLFRRDDVERLVLERARGREQPPVVVRSPRSKFAAVPTQLALPFWRATPTVLRTTTAAARLQRDVRRASKMARIRRLSTAWGESATLGNQSEHRRKRA